MKGFMTVLVHAVVRSKSVAATFFNEEPSIIDEFREGIENKGDAGESDNDWQEL